MVKAKRLPVGAEEEDEDLCEDEDEDDDRDEAKKTKNTKISRKLSDLVNIITAVHFHGFDKGTGTYLPSTGHTLDSSKKLVVIFM